MIKGKSAAVHFTEVRVNILHSKQPRITTLLFLFLVGEVLTLSANYEKVENILRKMKYVYIHIYTQ